MLWQGDAQLTSQVGKRTVLALRSAARAFEIKLVSDCPLRCSLPEPGIERVKLHAIAKQTSATLIQRSGIAPDPPP